MSVVDPDNPPAELDLTRIATRAAEWIEFLEEAIRDELDDGEAPPTVETVGLVVELNWPPSPQNNEMGSTAIRWTCTDARSWFQRGLFQEVADGVNRQRAVDAD